MRVSGATMDRRGAPRSDGDMADHGTVLVLAATGKIGRRLVPRLRAGGAAVRGVSRSTSPRFDWTDPATWDPVLDGVAAVFLVVPDEPVDVRGFVDRAVAAGARRVVVLSGRGGQWFRGSGFGERMADAEDAARASGAEWTVLRPNNFLQNFDEDLWRAPLVSGELALPTGGVAEPFVDADDVADVAAAVLTAPGSAHAGRVYELSGPRAVTFAELVQQVNASAGIAARYVERTPEQYRADLTAQGWPADAVAGLDALFALLRSGRIAAPTGDVRRVLGREPRGVEPWADAAAAAGAWAGGPVAVGAAPVRED
jgi:uncharacterized protein YbjT (DUF2867 family)